MDVPRFPQDSREFQRLYGYAPSHATPLGRLLGDLFLVGMLAAVLWMDVKSRSMNALTATIGIGLALVVIVRATRYFAVPHVPPLPEVTSTPPPRPDPRSSALYDRDIDLSP